MRDKEDIFVDVFLDDEPRSAPQSQSFSLSYGVEPVSLVLTHFTTGVDFYDIARTSSEESTDKISIVDFSEEADSL